MPAPVTLIGLDLGQRNDFTAISVVERHLVPTGDMGSRKVWNGDEWGEVATLAVERHYHCRHLDRYRDVPYPEVVADVVSLVEAIEGNLVLVVDATGVGLPVYDSLRAELVEALGSYTEGVELLGVLIHGGDRVTRGKRNTFGVPKRDLVGVAQVLLESRRLKVAEGLELRPVLLEEMRNFRVKIDPRTAHDSYSHWREQDHDDLVLSVALACWVGEALMRKQSEVTVPNHIAGYLADGGELPSGGLWG